MKKKTLILATAFAYAIPQLYAQNLYDVNGQQLNEDGSKMEDISKSFASDSIDSKTVPIAYYAWKVEERFGDIKPAAVDTAMYLFQNSNFTEGKTWRYNSLGNMGSPRLSRIFFDRNARISKPQFLFAQPYDFFITNPGNFLFTNTKSPVTNISYHECGNKENGEDRITALFAVNAGKKLGMGFKLDYLYGRGYYANQSTADFNASLYASYLSKNYSAHFLYSLNYLKTAENGGIEDDMYITNPESFPSSYSSSDIPTMLSKVWNKMHVNTLFFTHKYSLGYNRIVDKKGRTIKIEKASSLGAIAPKSQDLQSMIEAKENIATDSTINMKQVAKIDTSETTTEFIPVSSIIHTVRLDNNSRKFMAYSESDNYFTNNYFPSELTDDRIKQLYLTNTVALQVHEGFNKWVKAGLKAFVKHEFSRYTMPETATTLQHFTENDFTLGAQLEKEQGNILHYNVIGEMTTSGSKWGEFNVEGNGQLTIPMRKDTLSLNVAGFVRNETPSFFYTNYHSKYTWWDNSLNNEFRTRIEGTLAYNRTNTKFRLGIENIKNYTHFAASQSPYTLEDGNTAYSNAVAVAQESNNIQILTATLNQDLRFGIFNWENELNYQTTTNKTALPLPTFSAYVNMYLKFRIAKVLNTEFGADLRYFTKYYAPTYNPTIGQFATQDNTTKVEVGNYPIVNVYLNFQLKKCRFYIMASHVNHSNGSGNMFLVPHYPINPMTIKLGLSWNFYN